MIIWGWEYKEDAQNSLIDDEQYAEECYYDVQLKVYTKRYLETLIK